MKKTGCVFALTLLGILSSVNILAADRALLVGIDHYANGFGSLAGAGNDVEDMTRLLRSGFGVADSDIVTLTDQQATHASILRTMDEWLIDGTRPGDRVFFHFSGHGYYVPDEPGGDESGPGGDGRDEVLVAHDASCRQAAGSQCLDLVGVVTDDEVRLRLDRLQDRHVMLFIDSCHSGTMTRGLFSGLAGTRVLRLDTRSRGPVAPSPAPLREVLMAHQKESGFVDPGSNLVAFFAVAPNQAAEENYDRPQRVTGLFTSGLVRALGAREADADADGSITFNELLDSLRYLTKDYCTRHARDQCASGVTPQMEITSASLGRDVFAFGLAGDGQAPQEKIPRQTAQDLMAHSNPANLRIDLIPGPGFRNGELMGIRAWADRGGYLLLFDLDAAGTLTQLYPNPYSMDLDLRPDGKPQGWVRAGRRVSIPDAYTPFQWRAGEPFGEGRMIALLIEDAVDIERLTPAGLGFKPVQRPAEHLAELRERLNGLVHEADGSNREVRWSMAWADYRIAAAD